MRTALILAAILGTTSLASADWLSPVYITIDEDAVETARSVVLDQAYAFQVLPGDGDSVVITMPAQHLDDLSEAMHEKHNRCGGFMVHDTLEEAQAPAMLEKAAIDYTLD